MREENRSLKEYFFNKYNKNSSFHFSYLNFSEREKKTKHNKRREKK